MHKRGGARSPIVVWTLLVLLLGAAACSEDNTFTPTDPGGPFIPTIAGTYRSSDMWQFELTPEIGAAVNLTCSGSVTIGTQLGETFSGTFLVQDPDCGVASGTVTNGTYQSDGTITFGLTVPGLDPNFLTAAFICTYVSGDTAVSGTLMGTQMQAGSTTVMDCNQAGRSTLVVRLAGSR